MDALKCEKVRNRARAASAPSLGFTRRTPSLPDVVGRETFRQRGLIIRLGDHDSLVRRVGAPMEGNAYVVLLQVLSAADD